MMMMTSPYMYRSRLVIIIRRAAWDTAQLRSKRSELNVTELN